MKNAILIAGPTASGKSALALQLAVRTGGVVVNADSMQVYSVLHALAARPGVEEMRLAPHRLYGHVYPTDPYSTGIWMRQVQQFAEAGLFDRHRPIFVGGTGLYFRALTAGLSEMPDIPPAVRERWRYHLHEDGSSRLHRILREEDPRVAQLLKPTDGQRIVRALEVLEASGRSILDWQAERGRALVDVGSARQIVIEPARDFLIGRIERRFDRMVDHGAMVEAMLLARIVADPALPVAKAIGVRELQSVIAGDLSLEQATEQAKIATRQYAKRQSTWFRNQFGPEWQRVTATTLRDMLSAVTI